MLEPLVSRRWECLKTATRAFGDRSADVAWGTTGRHQRMQLTTPALAGGRSHTRPQYDHTCVHARGAPTTTATTTACCWGLNSGTYFRQETRLGKLEDLNFFGPRANGLDRRRETGTERTEAGSSDATCLHGGSHPGLRTINVAPALASLADSYFLTGSNTAV